MSARASSVALASVGHILVHQTDVLGPYPDGSDVFDITFSHQNYNMVPQPESLTAHAAERAAAHP